VRILSDIAGVDHLHVVVATVFVTASLGFVGGRIILTRRPNGEGT
jgi:hypothetical protein